jgi:hypothetical protein
MPLPIVWRVGRAGLAASRVGAVVGVLAVVGAATWGFAWPDADRLAAALVAALGLCLTLTAWRVGVHPSVAATETGLVIRNPLETVAIPWADLVEASAGFDGITISRLSATPTTIWAVQKSNLSTWRGARTRADAVAATIQVLASARADGSTTMSSGALPIVRREVTPLDAVRIPLRFPWRMTPVEATVIGVLRHSSSPLPNAAAAFVFGALGLVLVGLFAGDQWDARVLRDHGVVVQATVLDVPGQVKVSWPAIAPQALFLDGGDRAVQTYSPGEVVDVLSDPRHPTRAQMVGVEPDLAGRAGQLAVALGARLLASGYAKWSRWLALTGRDVRPTSAARGP